MKKLVLFVAVAVVVSFASCKKAAPEQIAPETEVETVEEATVAAEEDAEEAVLVVEEEVPAAE